MTEKQGKVRNLNLLHIKLKLIVLVLRYKALELSKNPISKFKFCTRQREK